MWSIISSNSAEMGTCLKYLFGKIFMNCYIQQNCMIIGLNVMYNFNKSRVYPHFSTGKKLLHVFWNTLYI